MHKFCLTYRDGKHPWTQLTRTLSGRLRSQRFNKKFKNFEDESDSMSSSQSSEASASSANWSSDWSMEAGNRSKEVVKDYKDEGKIMPFLEKADYTTMMQECQKEMEKKSPNRSHLKHLIKETFTVRRREIEKLDENAEPMVSSILEEWPCFEFGEYVSECIYTCVDVRIFC